MIPRYSHKEMEDIWSEYNQYFIWIKVEIEALKSLSDCAIIPNIEIPNIHIDDNIINNNSDKKLFINLKDFIKKCADDEAITTHDVASFINILEKELGECGKYLHYGMTGSDLVDTAFALRIADSLELIKGELELLIDNLYNLAKKYVHTPIMGRTHGMQAEPMSLGVIFGLYVAELCRNWDRLVNASKNISFGKMSGSVGTFVHISPKVEYIAMNRLNLNRPHIANQIIQRDRHAEVFNTLALTGTTLEKLATQIRHYSRPEVNEMSEGKNKGYVGSSSMPHKRNPIGCENICGLSRLLRGYAVTAMENNSLWHERDISHSSNERFIAPDAFGIMFHMINKMNNIIDCLVIDENEMKKKVIESAPKWITQFKMLKLIKSGMSRQEAHKLVQTQNDNDFDIEEMIEYYLRHATAQINALPL